MINFGEYHLQQLHVLFSRAADDPTEVLDLCPPTAHQHLRLRFVAEGQPDMVIDTLGDPESGEDWIIHPNTERENIRIRLQHTFQQLGVSSEIQIVDVGDLPPDMLPPGLVPKAADTEEDDDLPGFYL